MEPDRSPAYVWWLIKLDATASGQFDSPVVRQYITSDIHLSLVPGRCDSYKSHFLLCPLDLLLILIFIIK